MVKGVSYTRLGGTRSRIKGAVRASRALTFDSASRGETSGVGGKKRRKNKSKESAEDKTRRRKERGRKRKR